MFTILVADDDSGMRKGLQSFLSKHGYTVYEADDGKDTLAKLEKYTPDILLLDMVMPNVNGIDVLREIRKNFQYHLLYIIMITVDSTMQSKITGLDCGADDYMVKPFDLNELLARIRSGTRSIEARSYAFRDPLSNLYNRHFFNQNLVQEIERAERYNMDLSLIIFDLDHFKEINDSYGHSCGDDVLKEFGQMLVSFCRIPDIACRWGGDEFILLLPNTKADGVIKLGQRIVEKIRQKSFPHVGKVTISAGAATFSPENKDLFQNADKALYKAKQQGRDRFVYFDQSEMKS